jgi:hypothetical protein
MYCFIQLYYVHFGAYVFGVLLTSFTQFVEIFGIFCLVTWNFIFVGLTLITFYIRHSNYCIVAESFILVIRILL